MGVNKDKVAPYDLDTYIEPPSLEKSKKKTVTFDHLIDCLGSFGRFQLFQFSLLCLPTMFVAMHVMSWTFISVQSEMVCTGNGTDSGVERNCTTNGYSASDRWDMSGENSWIKASVQSLYFLGQMTGSFLCGIWADKIGRKKVFFLSILIQTTCGLLLIVAPWWWLYAILKAGTGFAQPGIFGVGIVLGMELVGSQYRSLGAVALNVLYAAGQVVLVGLAYFIKDYRLLHAAIAVPSLLFLSYWWIIRESPRWLVSKERYDEADHILSSAARMNKTNIPSQWWEQLERAPNAKNTSFGVTDLVRTPQMRKRTLTCFFMWPVGTMMYYGLTMKSDIGGGSLYLNFLFSAIMEIPSLLIVFLLIDRIGRKPLVSGGLLIAGIALVINWIIGDNLSYTCTLIQMMVTKGSVTVAYTAMYTYTSELFPTVIRNTAVGCCSTVARIGAISSSYIAFYLVESYGKLTMVIPFSIFAICAAVLSFVFLPETMNKDMPESISEVEGQDI